MQTLKATCQQSSHVLNTKNKMATITAVYLTLVSPIYLSMVSLTVFTLKWKYLHIITVLSMPLSKTFSTYSKHFNFNLLNCQDIHKQVVHNKLDPILCSAITVVLKRFLRHDPFFIIYLKRPPNPIHSKWTARYFTMIGEVAHHYL